MIYSTPLTLLVWFLLSYFIRERCLFHETRPLNHVSESEKLSPLWLGSSYFLSQFTYSVTSLRLAVWFPVNSWMHMSCSFLFFQCNYVDAVGVLHPLKVTDFLFIYIMKLALSFRNTYFRWFIWLCFCSIVYENRLLMNSVWFVYLCLKSLQ